MASQPLDFSCNLTTSRRAWKAHGAQLVGTRVVRPFLAPKQTRNPDDLSVPLDDQRSRLRNSSPSGAREQLLEPALATAHREPVVARRAARHECLSRPSRQAQQAGGRVRGCARVPTQTEAPFGEFEPALVRQVDAQGLGRARARSRSEPEPPALAKQAEAVRQGERAARRGVGKERLDSLQVAAREIGAETRAPRERDFLDETAANETSDELKEARSRIPTGRPPVPGLSSPNEKMEKSLLKSFAYRVLASEGVVSRNVAKRESERWGRSASEYHLKWQQELETSLADLNFTSKLKRVEHHLSHAANAYYTSGFDEALVVTLDGYGSGLAGSVSIGRDAAITRVHDLEYPHSLGTFYESVTSALGFTPSRHEGKIVGLAAYGDPEVLGDVLRRRFVSKNGGFQIVETNNMYFARMLASSFPKIDVAAAYQRVLGTL